MTARKKIVVYCQHLSGAGHYVRCREIIRALSPRHEVHFVVGGRDVPGRPLDQSVRMVNLPKIYRSPEGIVPLDSARSLEDVFHERAGILDDLFHAIRPDVFLIEHFPVSKWELGRELIPAIASAKLANPNVHVISSVRDHPAGSDSRRHPSHDALSIAHVLNEHFHALLVHSDPNIVRLDAQFTWIPEVTIPIHYTGYVSEPLDADAPPAESLSMDLAAGYVVVSSGGLADGLRLAGLCRDAWRLLHAQDATGGRQMIIFAGLFAEEKKFRELAQSLEDGPFFLRPFAVEFANLLPGADLSISQGGYNTTMNVLESRTRTILAPNRRTSDQPLRAKLFHELGLVETIDPETVSAGQIAVLIREMLARPRPRHEISLNGAQRTREWIERL